MIYKYKLFDIYYNDKIFSCVRAVALEEKIW